MTKSHFHLAKCPTAEVKSTATAQAATLAAQETTAAMQSTRQAFALAQAEARARREKVVTAATSALVITAATLLVALLLWLLWKIIPTLVTRAGLVRYGRHHNPLLLLERHGRTVVTDPLAMLQAALRVDENGHATMPDLTPAELQTLLAGGRLRLLLEQARHPPQLPAEVSTRRRVGPVESAKTVRHGAAPPSTSERPAVEAPLPKDAPLLPAGVEWPRRNGWHWTPASKRKNRRRTKMSS